MNKQLNENIKKHICLSEQELEAFNNLFTFKKLKKKDFFLKQGNISKHEAFVLNGCFRVFTTDDKGNEYVLYFAIQNWWLSDIDSFTNQIPSFLSIQALEDSELLVISKPAKEKAYKEIYKIEKLFRVMTQKYLVSNQRRIILNHSHTAHQRYQYFLENYPEIAKKLTNLQIASYLGISHEFLSKIRRNIASKK